MDLESQDREDKDNYQGYSDTLAQNIEMLQQAGIDAGSLINSLGSADRKTREQFLSTVKAAQSSMDKAAKTGISTAERSRLSNNATRTLERALRTLDPSLTSTKQVQVTKQPSVPTHPGSITEIANNEPTKESIANIEPLLQLTPTQVASIAEETRVAIIGELAKTVGNSVPGKVAALGEIPLNLFNQIFKEEALISEATVEGKVAKMMDMKVSPALITDINTVINQAGLRDRKYGLNENQIAMVLKESMEHSSWSALADHIPGTKTDPLGRGYKFSASKAKEIAEAVRSLTPRQRTEVKNRINDIATLTAASAFIQQVSEFQGQVLTSEDQRKYLQAIGVVSQGLVVRDDLYNK